MRIGIFHYHLKKAGVRDEIQNIANALDEEFGRELKVQIFAAIKKYGKDSVKIKLNKAKIEHFDLPELAYSKIKSKSKESFLKTAEKICGAILSKINLKGCTEAEPYVLYLNNVSLGKNPKVTAAFALLAKKTVKMKLPLMIINHVHDFADDKPAMMRKLTYCTSQKDEEFSQKIMYPKTRNMIYAVLSERDLKRLSKKGIPKKDIFVFPNAVVERKTNLTKRQLNKKITNFAKRNCFSYDEKKKTVLYPVKPIKRKNIYEALLLLTLINHIHENKYQLIITLKANSKADRFYSERIENFVKKEKMPVSMYVGSSIHCSIANFYAVSDMAITTSTKEGFGFTFLEPWIYNKPLFGRKIPELCKDFEKNSVSLYTLYKKLVIGKKKTDFPHLELKKQEAVIKKALNSKEYCKEILKNNKMFRLFGNKEKLSQVVKKNKKAIIENYSANKKVKSFLNIVEKTKKKAF